MNCPFCSKEIQTTINKPIVLFCPHCFSVIDKSFADYSFPKCDYDDRDVEKYNTNIQKQIDWFSKHVKKIPEPREDKEKDKKGVFTFILLMLLFFSFAIIGTGVLMTLVHPIIGLLFLMGMVVVGAMITHKTMHPAISEETIKTDYVPIAYYGNEYSFGYVEVNIKDYIGTKNHLVTFEFVEILKNHIKDVYIDRETGEYCVLLDKEVFITNSRKSDRIFVPDIFDEETFNKMIY